MLTWHYDSPDMVHHNETVIRTVMMYYGNDPHRHWSALECTENPLRCAHFQHNIAQPWSFIAWRRNCHYAHTAGSKGYNTFLQSVTEESSVLMEENFWECHLWSLCLYNKSTGKTLLKYVLNCINCMEVSHKIFTRKKGPKRFHLLPPIRWNTF